MFDVDANVPIVIDQPRADKTTTILVRSMKLEMLVCVDFRKTVVPQLIVLVK